MLVNPVNELNETGYMLMVQCSLPLLIQRGITLNAGKTLIVSVTELNDGTSCPQFVLCIIVSESRDWVL